MKLLANALSNFIRRSVFQRITRDTAFSRVNGLELRVLLAYNS
jgi:hypothetical protein